MDGNGPRPERGRKHLRAVRHGRVTVESTGTSSGRFNWFEGIPDPPFPSLPPTGVAYTVGSFPATAPAYDRIGMAFFTVNGALTDGPDVFSGLFDTGLVLSSRVRRRS